MAQSDCEKLLRGTTEVISRASLEQKLADSAKTKRALRVKAGFDPTAPDIHLGHVVLLRKLRQFQDMGHTVYFLIGDFTAQVGDPTGRDQLRPKMDAEQIAVNAKTYKKQVFKVLDQARTKVVFNSSWLAKLTAQQMLELTAHSSVAQLLARSDFKKRFQEQKEISLLEFVYPLLQGYDSVHLKADIELGGTDQKFNLLMGRQLQDVYGQSPQVVMMTPLLEGTDGVKKMSKSLGNTIGIEDAPQDIFGKIMSVNDECMLRYYEVLTDRSMAAVKKLHPKEAKLQLAQEVVSFFYPPSQALSARREFERVFARQEVPDDMSSFSLSHCDGMTLVDVMVEASLVESKSAARRLLKQGAVSFEGEKLTDENWSPQPGVLKVGKRRFLNIQP